MFPVLRGRLEEVCPKFPCAVEIILVDDGSRDHTLASALGWARTASHVKVVALSRNFGHQPAVLAGLRYASGDAAVIMDADLQDPPELVPEMIAAYCEGFEVVYAQRRKREGESVFKKLTAACFYRLMSLFVFRDLPRDTGDFRLVSRTVLDVLKKMPEHDPFLRGLFAWLGFPQKAVFYDRAARAAGTTKYPLRKMLRFALRGIVSFTDLPLHISVFVGLAAVSVSIALILHSFYMYLFDIESTVPGWASLMVALSFFSGMILLALGVIGFYLARIHTEVLQRPVYVVAHTANLESNTHE